MNAKKNSAAGKVSSVRGASGAAAGKVAPVPVAPAAKRGRGRPRKNAAVPATAPATIGNGQPVEPEKTAPVVVGGSQTKVSGFPVRTATIDDLISRVFEPESSLVRREGVRVAVLAATRHGKTTLIRRMLDYQRSLSVTLIHDEAKAEVQYASLRGVDVPVVGSVAEVDALDSATASIVFRGDVFRDQTCTVESVAAYALKLARSRVPVRLVVDELEAAVSSGGRKLTSESLFKIGVQGGQLGLSLIWSTQIPQRAPSDALSQCSAVVLGRLEASATNYLDGSLYFDRDMIGVLETLPVGCFVVRFAGQPWDRTVYGG